MIVVRSPLRITLGGGGTDLPSYADRFGGFTITAAITQYVYVSVLRPFLPGIYLKYSESERVATVDAVKHPLFRETFRSLHTPAQVEVTTTADIPAGTGLGSSSSFLTALVQALRLFQGYGRGTPDDLARSACAIEMDRCLAPIGRQDQYAAAFGGVQAMTHTSTGVQLDAIPVSDALEDSLLLFYTGGQRVAAEVLSDQATRTDANDPVMLDNLHTIKSIGLESYARLKAGDYHAFGVLLRAHWQIKRKRGGLTDARIDQGCAVAIAAGAIGVKLVGAGGCGFLLVYTERPVTVRQAMLAHGWPEVRCRFDSDGTQVIAA